MALVRPAAPFVSMALGYRQVLTEVDILDDTDPHVRAHPDCFVPVATTARAVSRRGAVEAATARPGERRNR